MIEGKRLLIMSLLLVMFPFAVSGQQSSSVTGLVTDTSGAVIRGVDVKLTDTKTATEQSTTTNEQGVYLFVRVAPGSGYRLTFTAQGFETLVVNDVPLGVGITETRSVEMTVGQVSTTVNVTAEAGTTLNTTDASIGNIIEERRL